MSKIYSMKNVLLPQLRIRPPVLTCHRRKCYEPSLSAPKSHSRTSPSQQETRISMDQSAQKRCTSCQSIRPISSSREPNYWKVLFLGRLAKTDDAGNNSFHDASKRRELHKIPTGTITDLETIQLPSLKKIGDEVYWEVGRVQKSLL